MLVVVYGGGKGLIFRRITSLKTFSLLLFFLCAIPIISHAQTRFYSSDGKYSFTVTDATNKYVSISTNGPLHLYRVEIPSSATDDAGITYTVTSIVEWSFYYDDDIHYIIIPSTIKVIGNFSFSSCHSVQRIFLNSITPPTLLGDRVFAGLPSNVTFFVPNDSYLTADKWSTLANNYEFVVETYNSDRIGLYTNRWNFVAGLNNQASLYNNNKPTSFVSGFSADNTINDSTNAQNPHCDIAIVGYDYSANKWGENSYLYANDNMTAGAGYFVWAFNENAQGTQITTSGEMTNVDMWSFPASGNATTLYLTEGSVNWRAINNGSATGSGSVSAKWFAFGNPFDKKLSKTDVLNAFTINRARTVQSDVLYTYDAYNERWNNNATDVLPGQGFMVAAVEGESLVSGTINYPTTNSAPAQPENYGIRFSVNANGINSDIFAKQVSEANDGFDTKDAYALFGNNENLVEPYFVVEGRQIIHNRYNSDNYACEINFHAQKSGVAELSVSDVPEGTIVSIVDLAMNEETVLEDNVFEFDVQVGENSGRYQIKIVKNNSSINTTAQNEANISIWNNNKEVFVKGEKLQRVEVYNTLGQKVYQREISGDAYNFTFDNEGAYIVKVTSENGTKSQKVQVLPAL